MTLADAAVSPATVPALIEAINDPRGSLQRVAAVVSNDAGLAARVLRVANSAQFGLSRRVNDIPMAVGLAGANLVQSVAIAGASNLLDGRGGLPHARHHAVLMAATCRMLAGRAGLGTSDAFAAGLLHDVGEILLLRLDPKDYAAAHASWSDAADQLRAERAMFGTDHAVAAREQLAEWQLPGPIVDAVGDHHRPDLCHRDLSTLVVAAEELVDGFDGSPRLRMMGVLEHECSALRTEALVAADELTGLIAA